jgi:hypothetical protein
MAPFFLVWAAYFALKALKDKSYKPAIAGGFLLGLGFHTYIAYRIMPLLFLFFIPKLHADNSLLKIGSAFALAAFISATPLLVYFAFNPQDFLGRAGQLSVFSSPSPTYDLWRNAILTLQMFNWHGDWNWRHNISGRAELFWPVGVLLILGVVIGVMKRTFYDIFLLVWFGLALLPVIISNEGLPHALRAILVTPAVFGIAARGGIAVWNWLKSYLKDSLLLKEGQWSFARLNIFSRVTHLEILAFLFLAMLFYEAYFSYFMMWGQNPNVHDAFAENYVDIGKQIRGIPDLAIKYVVVKANGVLVRGIPMPAQTVMFMTDSFSAEEQKRKNIHYLTPEEWQKFDPKTPSGRGAFTFIIE